MESVLIRHPSTTDSINEILICRMGYERKSPNNRGIFDSTTIAITIKAQQFVELIEVVHHAIFKHFPTPERAVTKSYRVHQSPEVFDEFVIAVSITGHSSL